MSVQVVQIEGFQELQQKLKVLGDDRGKRKSVERVLRKAARSTVVAARGEVPVRTGNLKKSIGVVRARRSRDPLLYVGPRGGRRYKNDGFYGGFVEQGTKKGIQPNRYMARAYNKTKGGVTREAVAGVSKVIQAEIAKLSS